MTTPRRTDSKSDSDSEVEREWQAQERAFQAERDATSNGGALEAPERDASANGGSYDAPNAVALRELSSAGDARAADGRYRLIARALRASSGDAPPADFAATVAARVQRQERAAQRFDAWLPVIVACLFGAGVIAATLFDARVWLSLTSTVSSILTLMSGPWMLALMACVLVTAASTRIAGGVARR